MTDFIQLVASGLAVGSVYALAAIGFVLVYSATGVVNFAAGQFVMLGTFAGVSMLVFAGLPWPVGYLGALLLMAAVGALFFASVYLPLRHSPQITLVIGTLAMGLVLQNGALVVFGPWPLRLPSPLDGVVVSVAGAVLTGHTVAVVVATSALIGLLWLLLHRTSLGIAMRAVAQDDQAAKLMGLRVLPLLSFSWVLAAVLAGFAGLMVGPLWLADTHMGDAIALKAFAAAIIGGFTSLPGAIAGGVLVGLVEVLGASYISSAYKDLIAFGTMILFLLVRPQGIFGESIQDRA